MAEQTSNFTTIYKIISDSDFTGLVKGSTALKNFAENTKASTKTVTDLTKVVDAGVTGVGDYLKTYDEGFNSIAERFSKLSAEGVTVGNTLKATGGVISDVLNTSLKQSAVGMETVGNLLSIDMVQGLVAFGAAAGVAAIAIGAVGRAISSSLEEGIKYARGLETTRIMLGATSEAAYTLSTSLVDSASRSAWSKVGEGYSGYINFFAGLGKATIAVKGYFTDMATGIIVWATPLSSTFDKWGASFTRLGSIIAESSPSLAKLKLNLNDIAASTNDTGVLNAQFEKIAASMGVGSDVARKYYDTLKNSTRDATGALNILQVAAQGALGSEFLRQNADVVINSLAALKTGAAAPVNDLIKLGVEVKDVSGYLANNATLTERFVTKLVEMGKIAPEVGKELVKALNTGQSEAQAYDQRIERLKRFNVASLKEQIDFATQARDALAKTKQPEKVLEADVQIAALRRQYASQLNEQLLRGEIDHNKRIEAIRGNELQTIKNNAQLERQIYVNNLAAAKFNSDEQKAIVLELKNFEARVYQDRRNAAEADFKAKTSLGLSAINALKSAGVSASGGQTNERATLGIIQQQQAAVKAKYAEADKGSKEEYQKNLELLQLAEQSYAVFRDRRTEILNQTEGGLQAISQISERSGSTVNSDISRAKQLANIRLNAIKEELTVSGISDSRRLELTKQRTDVELQLQDSIVNSYRSIGQIATNIGKQSISDLNTQRINADRLLASAAAGRNLVNPSSADKAAARGANPNDVRSISAELTRMIQAKDEVSKLDGPIKALYAAVEKSPKDQAALLQDFLAKNLKGMDANTNALISESIGKGFKSAVETSGVFGKEVKPSERTSPADAVAEMQKYIAALQPQLKDNTEKMLLYQQGLMDMAKEFNKLPISAETFKNELAAALAEYKLRLAALDPAIAAVVAKLTEAIVNPVNAAGGLLSKFMSDGGNTFMGLAGAAGKSFKDSVDGVTLKLETKTDAETKTKIDDIQTKTADNLTKLDEIKGKLITGAGAAQSGPDVTSELLRKRNEEFAATMKDATDPLKLAVDALKIAADNKYMQNPMMVVPNYIAGGIVSGIESAEDALVKMFKKE